MNHPLRGSMARRRANPNWGKGRALQIPTTQCDFEFLANELGLSPSQYAGSALLKEWARKYKDERYVPSDLLAQWGLTARDDF